MTDISAIHFLQNCHKNFEIDLKSQKIVSAQNSENFQSDCGWKEGHQWHYEADLQPLLLVVNDCLRTQAPPRTFDLNGLEIDYPLKIENGSTNINPVLRSVNPARLHFIIDIQNDSITLK